MTEPTDFHLLEEKIGYRFRDSRLLREALTHSSYSNEHGGLGVTPCNERLEFLGDAVLSVIVSRYLFHEFPKSPEGELTQMRAYLVCEDALAEYSRDILLGEHLILGRGEEKNGARTRASALCDAYEAVIAAVYLDGGATAEVRETIAAYVLEPVKKRLSRWDGYDYKSMLQEVIQRDPKGERLEYVKVREEGPDHAKVFTVEARIDGNVFGTGTGARIQLAEQKAAKEALIRCGELKE